MGRISYISLRDGLKTLEDMLEEDHPGIFGSVKLDAVSGLDMLYSDGSLSDASGKITIAFKANGTFSFFVWPNAVAGYYRIPDAYEPTVKKWLTKLASEN